MFESYHAMTNINIIKEKLNDYKVGESEHK